jgi:hypothetical protein
MRVYQKRGEQEQTPAIDPHHRRIFQRCDPIYDVSICYLLFLVRHVLLCLFPFDNISPLDKKIDPTTNVTNSFEISNMTRTPNFSCVDHLEITSLSLEILLLL